MKTANLTTKDVARLLRISEATVKRWDDDGLLRAEKTVGGHRRFSIQAIASLRKERGMGADDFTSPQKKVRKKSRAKPLLSSADFTELLLRGDEDEASAALIDAYLNNHRLASLFDTTITHSMHKVGDLWFQGTITVADEHLTTRILLSALQKLRGIVVPDEPTGLTAICCGIEGDLHELPIHLAEIILEASGWEVTNLGPNTPLFALRDMVVQKRPQLICISARAITDLDRTAIEYVQLRKIAEKLGVVIVLGGEGFRDTTLRARFLSDYYVEDFAHFSDCIQSILRKKV